MAKLGSKPFLVASLNVMLAARNKNNKDALSEDEIVEILSAMAETEAMASGAHIAEEVHWQNGPRTIV